MDSFNKEVVRLADISKGLSHPARIQILKILANTDNCLCGDIVELIPLSQSTVSQHLKELKRVGLIKGIITGPKTCYCLHEDALAAAKAMFLNLFEDITI